MFNSKLDWARRMATFGLLLFAFPVWSDDQRPDGTNAEIAATPPSTDEQTISIKPKIAPCNATINITHSQHDTTAQTRTTLDTQECAAAHGDYTLIISLEDDRGVTSRLEFPETWSRTTAGAIKLEREYPVGKGVTIKGMRTRALRCFCEMAEAPATP